MPPVGMPAVTERAYSQSASRLEEAARFAEAAVLNGLGQDHPLAPAAVLRLKAQIERDYLVSLMRHRPEAST